MEKHEKCADWERFTFARVRVLSGLADGSAERENVEHLGISFNAARRQVEDLKEFTGCAHVREIARWWRDNRERWLAWCAGQAGAVS